jgi:hypothetical protein
MGNWYEGAEAATFKQMENGYVYSNPWYIGPSRRYLVNEAQKAAITARMQQLRWVMPFGAILGLFAGLIVAAVVQSMVKPGPMVWDIRWFALMLAVVAPIMAIAYLFLVRKLRPLIAGLPPTRERVTWSDRLKVQAAHTSWSWIVGIGAFFGAYVLFGAIGFAVTGVWNNLVPAALFFPYVVFCVALAGYKAGQAGVGLHT